MTLTPTEILLDMLSDWTEHDLPSLTCIEADTIADFVREHRGDAAATRFLYSHSRHDDDPEDSHFEMEEP